MNLYISFFFPLLSNDTSVVWTLTGHTHCTQRQCGLSMWRKMDIKTTSKTSTGRNMGTHPSHCVRGHEFTASLTCMPYSNEVHTRFHNSCLHILTLVYDRYVVAYMTHAAVATSRARTQSSPSHTQQMWLRWRSSRQQGAKQLSIMLGKKRVVRSVVQIPAATNYLNLIRAERKVNTRSPQLIMYIQ